MSGRPLHFIWIADCSGSMAGDKIQSLNTAIREAIPEMRGVAHSNPHARVLVRALKFSSGATWHVTQPVPIEQFQWQDLQAGGVTDMGKALLMVADELKMPPMDPRGLPPVLVLISDGYPTDDVNKGISAILDQPWGKKAVRIAIGIGHDVDNNVLQRFINHPEIQPLQAHNAEQLVNYIKWASTAVLQSSSSPAVTDAPTHSSSNLNIPVPAPTHNMPTDSDVW
ncbi:von Willebrand factor type A [Ktedonobacter racemifer DSM 44963]|uniref:von Willebrand factor type A n=2 Tax=Ktedonobacter racemifer TaxID=363277 RepID=D6U8K4_KTERA|nr:von Willebrand factor type A [Ktedonobacter racemifer DSM 44963]